MEKTFNLEKLSTEDVVKSLKKDFASSLEFMYEYIGKDLDCMVDVYYRKAQAYEMAIKAMERLAAIEAEHTNV